MSGLADHHRQTGAGVGARGLPPAMPAQLEPLTRRVPASDDAAPNPPRDAGVGIEALLLGAMMLAGYVEAAARLFA